MARCVDMLVVRVPESGMPQGVGVMRALPRGCCWLLDGRRGGNRTINYPRTVPIHYEALFKISSFDKEATVSIDIMELYKVMTFISITMIDGPNFMDLLTTDSLLTINIIRLLCASTEFQ